MKNLVKNIVSDLDSTKQEMFKVLENLVSSELQTRDQRIYENTSFNSSNDSGSDIVDTNDEIIYGEIESTGVSSSSGADPNSCF